MRKRIVFIVSAFALLVTTFVIKVHIPGTVYKFEIVIPYIGSGDPPENGGGAPGGGGGGAG